VRLRSSCSGALKSHRPVELGFRYGERASSRCTLADQLSALLDDGSGRIHPELVPLADSLLAMDRPRSGLSWLSMRKGQPGSAEDLLRWLGRGEIELTHEAFLGLESWRAAATTRPPPPG
jgi:hypothetical protein